VCGAISAVQQMVRCGKKPPQIGENAKMSQFLKVALTQNFSLQILPIFKNFKISESRSYPKFLFSNFINFKKTLLPLS
jgi:hypothetical protein